MSNNLPSPETQDYSQLTAPSDRRNTAIPTTPGQEREKARQLVHIQQILDKHTPRVKEEAPTAWSRAAKKHTIQIEEQNYFPNSGPGQAVSKETSENPSHQNLSKEYLSYVDGQRRELELNHGLVDHQEEAAAQPLIEAGAPEQSDAEQAAGNASMFKTLETPQPEVVTDVRPTHTNTHAHTSASHENLALMDLSSKEQLVMLGPDGDDSQSPKPRPQKPDFKAGCQTMLRTSQKSSAHKQHSL